MTHPASAETLQPHLHARLVQFARACRAAASAVGLYPTGHPAIRETLGRLVTVSAQATADESLRITVLPDVLLLDGAAPARPDPGVSELAALLHRHAIGRLVLYGGSDVESWRSLLLLLARPPDELRADGGLADLWRRAGGPSIEIEAIDFTQVLQEHAGGEHPDLAGLIEHYLKGRRSGGVDAASVETLLTLAGSPGELRRLVGEGWAGESGGAGHATSGFLDLARQLVRHVARETPERLDAVLQALSRMAAGLPADTMAGLLTHRGTASAEVPPADPAHEAPLDLVDAITTRMDDETVADFVAGSLSAAGRSTEALAGAFRTLIVEPDRRERVLELAGDRLAAAAGGDTAQAAALRHQAREMLTSTPDQPCVSEEYAQELGHARLRAVDVEQTADDPPDRIAAWLDTVSDAALRVLDLRLLVDLLHIEVDLERWDDMLHTASAYIEDLARVDQFEPAAELAEAISRSGLESSDPSKRVRAEQALDRVATGPVARLVIAHLRGADAQGIEVAERLSVAIGPAIARPLIEALATEQDAKQRRRLQAILMAFGPRALGGLQRLMSSDSPEVRRTVVYLLRELGADGGALPDMEPLLADADPRVQREAIRTIALAGDSRSYAVLARAVTARTGSPDVQVEELASLSDERAAPLFRYLVLQLDPRSAPTAIYAVSLRALGRVGGHNAIEPLQAALRGGAWWQPFRTAAIRTAAAEALRAMGTPAALAALREAACRRGGAQRTVRRVLANHGTRR